MESGKTCACKGIRTCLLCETLKSYEKPPELSVSRDAISVFIYCPICLKAFKTDKESVNVSLCNTSSSLHDMHCTATDALDSLDFPGVELVENFVSEQEEKYLVTEIEKTPWTESQSGRRKQDYGPKVNFKKKKLKTAVFTGLPSFSQTYVERMKKVASLKDFTPVELCNLEYLPSRGSAIDAHFDDFWLWGERLVTLNFLSPIFYTMSKPEHPSCHVYILFPRRSLLILSGAARYKWMHAIQREHVPSLRIGTTLREFTSEFLPGGPNENIGDEVIKTALTFRGTAIHCTVKS